MLVGQNQGGFAECLKSQRQGGAPDGVVLMLMELQRFMANIILQQL